MFGKFFASAFTGSMAGSGMGVFAVWGYVIANVVDSQVELNPKVLAPILGATEDEVNAAIAFLCAPDPNSRSKAEDGRRLVKEGAFAYHVVNHAAYRAIRDENDRREYNRQKKAEGRARGVNVRVKGSIRESNVSAHTEADTETETKRARPKASRGTAPTSAAQIVAAIRALAQEVEAPGQGMKRFIPRKDVEAMGPSVLAAYDQLGGADRFLNEPPARLHFLTTDFAAALDG